MLWHCFCLRKNGRICIQDVPRASWKGLTDRKVGQDLSQEWLAQIAQTLRCIITHQKWSHAAKYFRLEQGQIWKSMVCPKHRCLPSPYVPPYNSICHHSLSILHVNFLLSLVKFISWWKHFLLWWNSDTYLVLGHSPFRYAVWKNPGSLHPTVLAGGPAF